MYPPVPCETRSCALSVLLHNLSLLKNLSSSAPAGSLILFPEDALSGPGFSSHSELAPYTEVFPPTGSTIPNPCSFPARSVLSHIACLASDRNATVVANLGERSADGTLFFNTDVVVSGAGVILAKYRKHHLYYEVWDRGPLDPVSFVVGGVRIGLMTCNDLTFADGIGQLVRDGVEVVLAPSWWVNTPPVMTGVAFFAGFSAAWGVTLAVSGSGGSGWASSGAGVWRRGETLASFYSAEVGVDWAALVSVPPRGSPTARDAWRLRPGSPAAPRASPGFVTVTRVPLGPAGSTFSQSVAAGPQFSCSITAQWSTPGPLFQVAMSGNVSSLYPIFSQWPVQYCGILPCDTSGNQGCQLGNPVLESLGTLGRVSINATFDRRAYQVFPVVVGQGGQGVNLTSHCEEYHSYDTTSLRCSFPIPSQSLTTSLLAISRESLP